jgi:hypothetical protein
VTLLLVALLNIVGIPLPEGSSVLIAVIAPEPQRGEIARKLAGALRDSQRAGTISDGATLGSLADRDDAALARRVSGSFDVVLIARPMTDGRISAKYYTGDGSPLGSVMVSFAAPPLPAPVPVELVRPEVPFEELDPSQQAQFHRERLDVVAPYGPIRGAVGNQLQKLTWSALYQALGRRDLAEAYTNRTNLRVGLGIGGALAAMSGMAMLIALNARFCILCPEPTHVPDRTLENAVGGVLVGLGMASVVASIAMPQKHPSSDELWSLIHRHNTRLRQRLKYSPLTFAPTFGANMAAVTVSGCFQ